MTDTDRDALLAEIRDAAADYRDADERLMAAEADAWRVGLTADEVNDAKGLWLR